MDARATAQDEILSLPPEKVSTFVTRKIADKELSSIVRELNAVALDGNGADRQRALDALSRLGFSV